jgi:molybdopterin converting factor small subunit
MRVEFYGMLRLTAGLPAADFELPEGSSARDVLAAILARYPELRLHLLDESGNLPRQTPVFVDGRNPRLAAGGLDRPLSADSVISLFSPVASGRLHVEGLRAAGSDDPEDEK